MGVDRRYLESLEGFWAYLVERRLIWERRKAREAWPWTKDQVMIQFCFPNVYREHDRTSGYLAKRLGLDLPITNEWEDLAEELPRVREDPVYQLFQLRIARHFNRLSTLEAILPIDPYSFEPDEVYAKLSAFPGNLYADAYRTSPFTDLGSLDLIWNSVEALSVWAEDGDEFYDLLKSGARMKQVMGYLQREPGIGPFIGYLLACDLTWTNLVGYGEDDDVFPHSGSMAALRGLTGFPVNLGLAREFLLGLHERAPYELERHGFHFHEDRHLSLRNLEDGLCEYFRYLELKQGRSGRARRFQPPVLRRHLESTAHGAARSIPIGSLP